MGGSPFPSSLRGDSYAARKASLGGVGRGVGGGGVRGPGAGRRGADARGAPERTRDRGPGDAVPERGHDRRVPEQSERARRYREGYPPGERVLLGRILPIHGRRGDVVERARARVPGRYVARGSVISRSRRRL